MENQKSSTETPHASSSETPLALSTIVPPNSQMIIGSGQASDLQQSRKHRLDVRNFWLKLSWKKKLLLGSTLVLLTLVLSWLTIPVERYSVVGYFVKENVAFTVEDESTNLPIVNASVQLGKLTATSNANGAVKFSSVPIGVYVLIIDKPGYIKQSSSFTVTVSSTSTLQLIHLAQLSSLPSHPGSNSGDTSGGGTTSSGGNGNSGNGEGNNNNSGSGNGGNNSSGSGGGGDGGSGSGGNGSAPTYAANIEINGNDVYGKYNPQALASPNIMATDTRLDWATVEPTKGNFVWGPLDSEIHDWAVAGKKYNLIIRYIQESFSGKCASTKQYLPSWELQSLQAQNLVFCSQGGAYIPDYFSPVFQADLMNYITAIYQHIQQSPYRPKLLYVRLGLGAGGEGYPCLGCSQADFKQLSTWGLKTATDWKNWQEMMLAKYQAAMPGVTIIYPLGYDTADPQTGQPVDREVASYALQKGMGIGQEGLSPKPGYQNEINFFASMRAQYPKAYMQLGTVFALSDTKTSQCDEECELKIDIQRANQAGVFSVEWYPQDAGNSAFQSDFASWQSMVNQRTASTTAQQKPNSLGSFLDWLVQL